ncbi:hypothetical protein [Demequina maris]|uniref:hypothetical protein n=1 Tax=Demequina maris TaxID=1638982 RepID=UPI000782303B|nr:hypothetical protein [Demequina maris]
MQIDRYSHHSANVTAILTEALGHLREHRAGTRDPAALAHALLFESGAWSVTWTDGRVPPLAHRSDGPALVSYEPEGALRLEWYDMGLLHRGGGLPALIEYNDDGEVSCEEWWEHAVPIGRRVSGDRQP